MSTATIATTQVRSPANARREDTSRISDAIRARAELSLKMAALQSMTVNDGWDDEGGVRVLPTTWSEARRIVFLVDQLLGPIGVPLPFVSPSGDGSVHLTWTDSKGTRGVLEIGPDAVWWNTLSAHGDGDTCAKLGSADDALDLVLTHFG